MTEAPNMNVQAAESTTPSLKLLRPRRFQDPLLVNPPSVPPIPIYI